MTCVLPLGENAASVEPIWGKLFPCQRGHSHRTLLSGCSLTVVDPLALEQLEREGLPSTWKTDFLGTIVNFGRIIDGPVLVHQLMHVRGLRAAHSVHSLILIRQTLSHSDIDGRIVVPAGLVLNGKYVCQEELGGLTQSYFLGSGETSGDPGRELGVIKSDKFDARCWFLCENRE